MQKKLPYIFLIFATMFWGGNFVMGRGFTEVLPPFTLALVRWIIAFLCILPFAWKEIVSNKNLWKKEFKTIFFISLTGIACFNTLVYIAVHYTTSINAALVNAPTPVFIMLLSFLFLKQKLIGRQVVGIVFSIIGVIWIISRGSLETLISFSVNIGELWMLLAVLIWSVYSILIKKHAHKFPMYGFFALTILIGTFQLLPFAAYEWITDVPMVWNSNTFFGLLYLGVFASVVAFLFWNKAVEDIGPSAASPFLNLIPVFSSFFAIIFLGEKLQMSQVVGGIIVISGVLITTGVLRLPKNKKKASDQAMKL